MMSMVLERNHSGFMKITRILETPVIVILGVETTTMLKFKLCFIQGVAGRRQWQRWCRGGSSHFLNLIMLRVR